MCEFFSCIYTKDGRILFTESDSHEKIIKRAGLKDNDPYLRSFVRLECVPPFNTVRVDEYGTLPAWFNLVDAQDRVIDLAKRVNRNWRIVTGKHSKRTNERK